MELLNISNASTNIQMGEIAYIKSNPPLYVSYICNFRHKYMPISLGNSGFKSYTELQT